MQNFRRLVLSLCLAATAWAASPADQPIADGRAALVAHDLATARQRFTEAVAADPANETAAALLGITRWFALVGDTPTQTFLDGAGVAGTGRNLYNWTASLSKNAYGVQVLPSAYSSTTALNFLRDNLAAEAVTVRGHLAAVTSDSFLLTLSAQETSQLSVTVDKGDILMARAGLRAFEFLSHLLNGQNLTVDAAALLDLAHGDLLTLPKVLQENPNLLTAGSPSERSAARAALLDVISLYRQASAFIRSRPAGVERLFMLDPKNVADEAMLRDKLTEVEQSLDGYVALDDHGKFGTLAPLFTAGYSLRSQLPDPSQPFDVQTIAGNTFNGLVLGLSREEVARAYVQMGFAADYGWTTLNPTPVAESISKYVYTGTAHVLLGNGGVIGRSTDGTTFSYQVLPDAQDLFGGAIGNGVIVATGQSEIWLSSDDGLTWTKVFKTFTGVDRDGIGTLSDVTFDGTAFLAVSFGGRTWRSTDGRQWVSGKRIQYGSAFPSISAMSYGGGRYVAVGFVNTSLGGRSAIFSSTNGTDWVQSFVGSTGNLYRSVAFGNGCWVVGGQGGRMARSLDGGLSWAELFTGDTNDTFYSAGYNGGTYVLAGSAGRVATSTDAVNWAFQTVADTPTFFDASASSGSLVYLVGSAGAVYRASGATVTRLDTNASILSSRTTAFEEAVVFNNKLYVGGSDGAVYESTDGTNFTVRPTGNTFGVWTLTVHNGAIFAAGVSGTIISSSDGINWQTRLSNNPAVTQQILLKIASVNGQLIAVGLGGTLLTSPDGVTWTKRATNVTQNLRCVAFGDGRYVVGADAAFQSSTNTYEGAILTSTDGVTWTRSVIRVGNNAASQPGIRALLRRGDHFLAFLNDGSVLRSSFNNGSLTFNEVATGLGTPTAAFEDNGVVYSLSARANDEIHSTLNYSLDEQTWVRTEVPTSIGFFGSAIFGNRFYVFANYAQIKRSAPIVANPRAPAALTAAAQTIGIGGNVGLGVPIESSEALTYQWSYNGSDILGATGAVLSLSNVQAGQSGVYTLTATGVVTSTVITGTVNLNVVAAPPFITHQPANTVVAPGETAVLAVEATGSGPLTYAWFKNGTLIPSATTAVLTIANVTQADAGDYRVEVSNATGTTPSLDAVVRVTANVPGFWQAAPSATNNYAPSRTIHDGLGHIYTTQINTAFDIVGNQTKGSLIRLDEATGAIDPAFQWDDRLGVPSFVAVQPDGKLLVAVSIGAGEGTTVLRINSNGSRDPSFNAPFFDHFIRFITRQPDGNVLVGVADNVQASAPAGAVVSANPTLYRLLGTDGSMDGGFTPVVFSSGAVIFSPPVLDGTGRIYLLGLFNQVNGVNRINIARVSSAGVLDTTFADPANSSQLPAGFASGQARGLAFQSDGRAVVVGDFRYTGRGTGTFNGSPDRIMAIRFNTDGTFDNSFVQPLRSQLPMNHSATGGVRLRYLVIQPDDKIVVVSDALMRLNPNGSFDGSFQPQSFSKETFWLSRSPATGNLYVTDLPEPDATGGIAAFTAAGLRITTFNPSGWGSTSAPGTAFALANGSVMAGGNFNRYGPGQVSGGALFSSAGYFVSDATPFYHPNAGLVSPLTQITGWADGSFVVRESDFGEPNTGYGSSVSTRRFNADGSENLAWNFAGNGPDGAVLTAVEPGKLLVWFGSLNDVTLVEEGPSQWFRRYNADGSLDPSFAPDLSGLFSINRDGSNNITSVTIGRIMQVRPMPDGSMLIAIIDASGTARVAKLLANGQMDPGYTVQSLGAANATSEFFDTAFDPVKGVMVDYAVDGFYAPKFGDLLALPDGRAYVAGALQLSGQPFGLARLLADGTLDAGFTGAGLAYTGLQPLSAYGVSLGLDDFGRVYLTGRFDHINGFAAAGLARFDAAGALDTAFAPGIEIRADRLTNSMVVGAAGRLHVMGAAATPGAPTAVGYLSVPITGTAPVILGQSATSQSLTAGQSLQLFAGSFGGAGATQQWSFNGTPITGATSSVLSIPGVTSANAGNYTFTVTNGQGSQSITSIAVAVSNAPLIVGQPQGGSVVTGGSLTLKVGAFGAAPLTYQWKKDTVDIGGATGSSYTISNAQAGDAGSYTVVVTNGTGNLESSAAVVTVSAAPTPPTIVLQPVSQSVVSGYTTILSVAAAGSGNSVQWFRDGVLQSGGIGSATVLLADGVTTATATTLTVTNSTLTAPTAFVATITGGNGAVANSNVATLTPIAGYSFSTLAGSASAGSADGTGNAARFRFPQGQGAVVDASGNVYVADSGNHAIRKITPAGVVTTLAGLAGSSGSSDGTGSVARFNNPYGLTIDGGGNLYVADTNNHIIRKVTSAGVVTTLAGLAGNSGSTDNTGTLARFNNPRGITFAPDGNLYVAEGQHTVRRVTLAGAVTTLAGLAGTAGSTDNTGTAARFNNPYGIAADTSGNLFVADTNNATIRQIVISSGVVTTLAGTAGQFSVTDGTGAAARFSGPRGLTVLGDGTIYVADSGGNVIRKIVSGAVVTTYAGTAYNNGYLDGTGAAARFNNPVGLAADASGTNLYVLDCNNNVIRQIVISSAAVTTLAGFPPGSADGTGPAARFALPQGLVRDSAGNLFVADTQNHIIRKITPAGVVTTFAGTAGLSGNTNGTGSAARFSYPQGLAIDGSDNLYVADSSQTIRVITPAGAVSNLAGLAFNSGSADGTTANGLARFNNPTGIVFDSVSGALYVTDTFNHTIRKVTLTGDVTTIAGTAGSFSNTNGTGSAARFNQPRGLAVDASGNVFVADTQNHIIRKVTPAGVVTTFAGYANLAGTTDGTGTSARFNQPRGLVFDPTTGNLYETDSSGLVRAITAGGSVTTLAGSAFTNGSADGIGTVARLNSPFQLAVDSAGVLSVADTNNSTIRRGFSSAALGITTQPAGATVVTGGNATFTVVASGAPTINYQWLKGGVVIDGQTAATLTLTNVQAGDAANYSVVVSNAITSITSSLATLAVVSPAANDSFASAQVLTGLGGTSTVSNLVATGEAGEPSHFNQATINSSLWYQWTPIVSGLATIDTFGSNTNTAIAVYTGTSFADLVFLAQSNDADGVAQSRVTMPVRAGVKYYIAAGTNSGSRGNIVLNFAVAVWPTPSANVVTVGQPVQFAVTLDGAAVPAVGAQWNHNGVDLGGATAATFNIASATGADAGFYRAGITLGGGAADYSFSLPAYLLVGDTGSTTVLDRFDGLSISNQWLPNPLIFLPSTEAGFAVNDQLQFTTSSTPAIPIDRALQSATNLPLDRDWTVVTRLGLGTSGQFSGVSGTGSLRKAGMSLGIFSPVNALDALSIGARIFNTTGTVVREAFADFDQNGNSTTVSSALGATQTGALVRLDYSALTGQVTASLAGPSGFTPVTTVEVINGWALNRSQSLRVVLRGFSTRLAVTPGTVYADDFGVVIAPQVITTQPASQSVGRGSNVTFSVTAATATAYQWFHNGVSLGAGATGASLNLTNVGGADAGAYTVQVTTATGSVTSATAQLVVSQFEILTQPTHTTVAAGAPAALGVTVSGNGPFTCQWFRNGASIGGATAATLNIGATQTTDEGYYTVTVSDGTTTLTTRPALLAVTDDPNVLRLSASQPTAQFKFVAPPTRVYVDGRGGLILADFFQGISPNNLNGNRLDAVLRLDAATGAPDLNYARIPQLSYAAAAAPQPDGTVIVVGSTETDYEPAALRLRLFRYRTDGTLDPNYHGAFVSNYVRFITRMTDGRLLLAASAVPGPTSVEPGAVDISVINRFLPDGTRDPSFTPPVLNAGGFLFAEPRIDSQGRILIAGLFTTVNGTARSNLARLNSDGTLDTTFNPSGFTIDPSNAQGLRAAVPVAGDKVLIGGRRLAVNGTPLTVARLNADGSLDPTFVLTPSTNFGLQNNNQNNTRYIATLPSGRFYAAAANQIIRFFDDGSVDNSFLRVVAPSMAAPSAHVFTQLITLDDGTVFTTIDAPVTQNGVTRQFVLKINSDGSFDPAFNAPEFAREAYPTIALPQPDGAVIVGGGGFGGSFNRVGANARGGLVRILANGSVDPAFNTTAPAGLDTMFGGGLATDGKIYALVSGTTASQDGSLTPVVASALVRYNTDGSLDGTFVPPAGDLSSARLRVQGNQPYVFMNNVSDVQSGQPLAARLNADGSVDNTFSAPAGALGAVDNINGVAALAPFDPIASFPGGGFLMVTADGPFTSNQTTFNVTLKKLKLDGTYDTTFTGPVIANVPTTEGFDNTTQFATFTVAYAPFTAATVLADGRVLIAGRTGAYGAVNAPGGVALLDATGAPDAAFATALGTGPQTLRYANTPARVDKFLVQASGKILVTGSFDTWDGKPAPGIVRLNSNGSLDPNFYAGVSYYSYLPTPTNIVSAGGNAFWLLGQYRRGVAGWPEAVNRVEFPAGLAQTITFNALPDVSSDTPPITLTATATSGLTVTFSVVSGPANVTGNTLTLTGATGVVTVRASQTGDDIYGAATPVDRSFTVTAAAGFSAWQSSVFTSGELADVNISGPNAVYGQDGLPNLVKYALGLDPKQNITTGLPAVGTTATDWVYTYTRRNDRSDVTCTVEFSTNLTTWTSVGLTDTFVSTSGSLETRQATYPLASATNIYFRLKVTQP